MAQFVKLNPVNGLPRRIRIDKFSNGLLATLQYGSLDIPYLDKTGKTRYDYRRGGQTLRANTESGLFASISEVKVYYGGLS